MSSIKLRDYQQKVVEEGIDKLHEFKCLYLALEMRLGKTLISMSIAEAHKYKHVLFVTVKKAIPSIKKLILIGRRKLLNFLKSLLCH